MNIVQYFSYTLRQMSEILIIHIDCLYIIKNATWDGDILRGRAACFSNLNSLMTAHLKYKCFYFCFYQNMLPWIILNVLENCILQRNSWQINSKLSSYKSRVQLCYRNRDQKSVLYIRGCSNCTQDDMKQII